MTLGQIISVGSDISGKLVKTGNVMLDDFLNGKSTTIPTGEKAKLPESGSQVSPLARNNIDNIQSTAKNIVSSGTKPESLFSNDEKLSMLGIDSKNNLNGMVSNNILPVKEGIGSESRFTRKPSEAFSEGSLVSNTSPSGNTSWKGSEKYTMGSTSPRPSSIVSSSASPI